MSHKNRIIIKTIKYIVPAKDPKHRYRLSLEVHDSLNLNQQTVVVGFYYIDKMKIKKFEDMEEENKTKPGWTSLFIILRKG